MRKISKSSLLGYVAAVLFVIAATLVTALLSPVMPRTTFLFFILAVLLSAWRGGHGPGLLATALSAFAADYFVLPSLFASGPQDMAQAVPLIVFVSVAVLVSVFTSESRRTRKGLLETTDALESIVQSSPLALISIDLDGNIKTWNPAAEYIFGWRAEEVVGRPNPIVPADKMDEYRAIREQAARSHSFVTREAVRVRRDGSLVNISLSTAALRDGRGTCTGTIAVISDITGQKQAQERLKLLATAVEQAAESIIITDPEGLIQYVNPAFERTTGFSIADTVGKTPRILNSGKQDQAFYENLWRCLKRGEVWTGHFTNKRKDGSLFEEEATISPVRDASGEIINFVAVKRDVTKEVGLEQQLIQSQKMEAVGTLAGGIAHDFNNLLTAIVGYSQLAMGKLKGADPLRADIAEIEKAGQRAAALTSQLLAFSRRQVFQPKILDLNALVTDLQKMLRRLIGEDIDMVALLDLELGAVKADPSQLQQVIMNLVVNARDAMPYGGKLTIETANVELDREYTSRHIEVMPGSYVMISITDTGCGMDQKTRAHIFDPFFTTKELGRGTGLGLSTVYGIVKQSGGYIWVYSEPGRGSTFKVYLPRVVEPVEEAGDSAKPAPLPNGTETLLLVEDEQAVRELAARVLKERGYRVLQAGNGIEALRISAAKPANEIQLLVTDVVMPNMDGPDLASRLKQSQGDLRVLYVSGYTDKAIVHRGVLDEGTPFLQKPFTPEALARKVREVLDERAIV
jgi:two-component system cell cycle sensor histidine kinase/response regulator CckA